MTDEAPPSQILLPQTLVAKVEFYAPTLTQRAQLVWQHLYAAALFSRTVGSIEAAHKGEALGAFVDEIYAHASPCVVMAAAGVEAYANQVFADRASVFAHADQNLLDGMWDRWGERLSAMEKCQFAFQLKGLAPLNVGGAPAQSVVALFHLRNALTISNPNGQTRGMPMISWRGSSQLHLAARHSIQRTNHSFRSLGPPMKAPNGQLHPVSI